MKTFLSAIAIAAGIASAYANPVNAPQTSATTTYTAEEPFYHVVGDNSYVGLFEAKPDACSVWVLLGPAVVTSSDKDARQVKFDLRSDETFTFVGSDSATSLNLHCAADAKSLAINQVWTPVADAKALRD